MNDLNKRSIALVAILLVLMFGWAKANPVHYTIHFLDTTGPAGIGSFVFDDCLDVVICPSFSFSATFGPGLVFENTLVGGGALFLEAFFTGTLQPLPQGTNFDSADGLSLLSLVTTGEYCIRDFVGASGSCSEDPGVFATGTWSVTRTPMPVDIDIKPGNKRNKINPRSRGKIWVAILSDTDAPFDPLQTKIPSVGFGPDGARANRNKVRDINRDGLGDLLLRFKIRRTGIQCGDTEAKLTGETFDGQAITGSDAIRTVGCH